MSVVNTASWRVCDPDDPLSYRTVSRNKHDLEIARASTPDPEDVIDDATSRLAVRLGTTDSVALSYMDVGMMLQRYTRLAEHLEDGHLPFESMRKLATSLESVPEELTEVVEAEVLDKIQATSPNQAVPSTRRLHNICQRVIEVHCPPARPMDDPPLPPPPPQEVKPLLHVDARRPNTTKFILTLNKADAEEVLQMLQHVSREALVDRGEAMMSLLRSQTTTTVTLNLYRDIADTTGSVHVAGQWLHPMVSKEWMERVTHVGVPG